MSLQVRLLGPVQAAWAGEGIPLTVGHQRALLALLALSPGRALSLETIADALWNGDPPARATAGIRVHVSQLRAALGRPAALETRPGGYVLNVSGGTDVQRFEDLSRRARAEQDSRRRARLLRDALALWRGSALADLAAYEFARREADRLEEARLAALEARISADLENGVGDDVVVELTALTAEHPWREKFWVQRITALSRGGRQADALSSYREIRERLADELGIDPSPELREAERAVLQQTGAAWEAAETVEAASSRRGNLTAEVSSFIGRARECAQVAGALEEHRIVTLTGVGGVGKTRLALRVAADIADRFPDGVWTCALAPLHAGESVAEAVAGILGVPQQTASGVRTALVDFLGRRRLLLILDNCEHLLLPVAELIELITGCCPNVSVLATSREGLAVDGERLLTIASLPTPAVDASLDDVRASDAVMLFVDRAFAAGVEVRSERDLAAAADICRRLDGIPLAIELAAARVRVMSPEDVAAHLDERFQLLTGGRRTALARHQTLRHAIDWSYALLDEREQLAMDRLAVFAGSFTLRSAQAVITDDALVAGEVLDAITRLVAKSLVQVDIGLEAQTRYSLLETVRQYAEERLEQRGDIDSWRSRHAAHFSVVVDEIRTAGWGSTERQAVLRFDQELDNLRSAFGFYVDRGDVRSVVEMLSGLGWEKVSERAEPEVAAWAATVVGLPGADEIPGFEDICGLAGMLGINRGGGPIDIVRRGMAAARRNGREPHLLCVIPFVAIAVMNMDHALREEGIAELEAALARADMAREGDLVAYGIAALGSAYMVGREFERAVTLARRAWKLADACGSPSTKGWTTYLLGTIELVAGNLNDSEQALRAAVGLPDISRGVYQRLARTQLLTFELDQPETDETLRSIRENLRLAHASGALFEVRLHLMSLPAGLWIRDEQEVAVILAEATGSNYYESISVMWQHLSMGSVDPAMLGNAVERAHTMDLNAQVECAVAAIDRILARKAAVARA